MVKIGIKIILSVVFGCFLYLPTAEAGVASPSQAGRGLVRRLLPKHASQFVIEEISQENGQDVFEIEQAGKNIVLRGNNGVSIASALNWYLRHYANCHYSWRGTQLNLPKQLPAVPEKVRIVTPMKYRYSFNFVTYSYSFAWFDWAQWERLIDWMAMHGINMPLAITGEEAVWQATGRRLGLSDADMQEFFVGPAYLGFGWMGCFDGFGGPLPQSWIDGHAELQKNILARERAFGMTPVLQGFTGHAPTGLKKIYPQAKFRTLPNWCGFPGTNFIDPADPLFQKVGKMFIEEQTRLYGTDHLYASDTFIEMPPPSNDTKFLHQMGKSVYGAMSAADPEAIWVMQGWLFVNAAGFWQPPQAKALLSAAPEGKMIVIDLYCESQPTWHRTESFYGRQWLWCIVQDFGDTVNMHAGLPQIADGLAAAVVSDKRGKLIGGGYTMEGMGYTPVVYTMMSEMLWKPEKIDLKKWIVDYADSRYGKKLPKAQQAWQLFLDSTCRTPQDDSWLDYSQTVVRPPRLAGKKPYKTEYLMQAVNLLLECSDELEGVDTYEYDVVHSMRQVLNNILRNFLLDINAAYGDKDAKALDQACTKYLGVLRDMDELLATREDFLLGRWLTDAKEWATNAEERKLYEWNARTLITLWDGHDSVLNEYAGKHWSGLISGFYLPRWKMYFKDLKRSLATGKQFDTAAFNSKIRDWEIAWAHKNKIYPDRPQGISIEVASRIWPKYKDIRPGVDSASLTTGKPAKCLMHIGGYVAELANDGQRFDTNSFWAMNAQTGEDAWWQVDLEKPTTIGRVVVVCYYGDKRYYGFTVKTSLDGKNWTVVADRSDNKELSTSKGYTCKFDPHKARYIRIDQTHNSANIGKHLVEVMAYEQ